MSSSSSTQGSRLLPRQTSPLTSSVRDNQVTAGKRRVLPRPERTAKVGRIASSTDNVSAASLCEDIVLAESATSTFDSLTPNSGPPLSLGPLFTVEAQEILTLDLALQDMKKQRMDHYKQDVYIAPMAKPNLQAPDDDLFPLIEKVKEFLAGEGQVMLIMGDSGSGKSTFNRYLEYQLWQAYKTGERIPLFINIPALERPEKDLVAEQLRAFDFSNELIRELKTHRQLILICDGYDESQLTSNLHTTNLLNRPGQWESKLLITCRSQYLGSDYRNRFVPEVVGEYFRSATELFQEAVIAPFSKNQIEDYVQQYVPLELRPWGTKDYMDKLTTIYNLMDLVKNPFLLLLCLEALPSAIEGKTDLARLRVTRVHLYDNFVAHWMVVNKRRLQGQKLSVEQFEVLEELLDDGFEQNVIKFQQDLAAAIFREQEGRPIVDYTHKHDKCSWKAAYFNPMPETTFLRNASLLNRAAHQFSFVHRSVLEYFYSCSICPPVSDPGKLAPHTPFGFTTASLAITDHPLSQRDLVKEPSIVQFLAERVHSNPSFEQHLHSLIEWSKTDDQAGRAAANAITILVRAGALFNGANLRDIRIPGADLSAGQFDSAQLQGADLTGVNFTKSWIRQAIFTGAQMEGVQFGELVYLMTDGVQSCAFSPDGKYLVGGLRDGEIIMYDTATWTKVCTFQGHQKAVWSVVFSPSGHQLLSASGDHTIRLWDPKSRRCEQVLEGHGDTVTAVAFSPSGNQIASGSWDRSVRIWNVTTNPATFITIDCENWATRLAYSPDGLCIASDGFGEAFRIFDTQTGLPKLILKTKSQTTPCIAYSPDGQYILSGNDDGELQFWKTTDGQPGPEWKGHAKSVWSIDFSPNGHWIASSSEDKTVKLWSAQTLTLVSVFSGHSGVIPSVAFSPDSSLLASGSWDRTMRIWQLSSTETVLSNTTDPSSSMVYSPDAQLFLVGTRDGHLCQYDARTSASNLVHTNSQGRVKCIAYSPDGQRFAIVDNSREVKIRNSETGQIAFVLTGHTEKAMTAAFSPCGGWIATGSQDTTARLWDARSGKPGRVLSGHTGSIRSLTISPSDLRIYSGSTDGTIRAWNMSTGESRVIVSGDQIMALVHSPIFSVSLTREGVVMEKEFYMTAKYSPRCCQIASTHRGERRVNMG